ncbi:MAG: hypothetical protein GF353_14765 [Candidatus Lokiarchaeota archaeon]|nr:hypothetical protein [Candidatus Lokiarchaeota archaeon]
MKRVRQKEGASSTWWESGLRRTGYRQEDTATTDPAPAGWQKLQGVR